MGQIAPVKVNQTLMLVVICRTLISPLERILIVLFIVILAVTKTRAKGPPELSDLFGLHLVVPVFQPIQVTVAEFRPSVKVCRNRLLSDLLPRDVNEEFLK